MTANVPSVISVDSGVYIPDKPGLFDELARVLEPGGVGVLTDLVIAPDHEGVPEVSRFASTWGMPALVTRESYCSMLAAAGVVVESVTDLSAGSVRRFHKWTRLVLGLLRTPLRPLLARFLRRHQIPLGELVEQIKATHAVLDSLHHILVRFRNPA
jgi:phosphoethanolamine N-methyltransferase